MKAGIISFLPSDEEKRKIRKQIHRRQVEWFKKNLPMMPLQVVAQNYREGDFIEGVSYIVSDPLGPGPARNIFLRQLYSSDDDYMLIADDDIILYDYYGALRLFSEVENNPNKFKGIDLITGNNPVYTPFKKQNYRDRNVLTHWKFVRKNCNQGQPFSLYRNLYKYYHIEKYYKQVIFEDVDWSIDSRMLGINEYVVQQWQLKDMANLHSTIYSSENRANEEKKALRYVINQKGLGEKMIKETGRVDWSYLTKITKTPPKGYIKRETDWEYTQREIPDIK